MLWTNSSFDQDFGLNAFLWDVTAAFEWASYCSVSSLCPFSIFSAALPLCETAQALFKEDSRSYKRVTLLSFTYIRWQQIFSFSKNNVMWLCVSISWEQGRPLKERLQHVLQTLCASFPGSSVIYGDHIMGRIRMDRPSRTGLGWGSVLVVTGPVNHSTKTK